MSEQITGVEDMPVFRALWIDGVEHQVPHPVWAHFQTMENSNKHLAAVLAKRSPTEQLWAEAALVETSGRWTPQRKRAVVGLVAINEITDEDACAKWEISPEELLAWQIQFATQGLPGLMVKNTQGVAA